MAGKSGEKRGDRTTSHPSGLGQTSGVEKHILGSLDLGTDAKADANTHLLLIQSFAPRKPASYKQK